MSWDANKDDTWGGGGKVADEFSGGGGANDFGGESNEYGGGANEYGGTNGDTHGGGNRGCFNCGEEGHSKAECPNPAKPRPCFNCGQEGHTKAECPNPAVMREFTGTCRICEQAGHRAADCPTAPPKLCKNCGEEGHPAVECKKARKIDYSHIADCSAEQAWAELKAASEENDLDDMKEAVMKYVKANPDSTYYELETAFRNQKLNLYLIAIEKELMVTYTNMDLQGNLKKKYTISWRLSPNHLRPKEKDSWPATPEENLERLLDAGEPVDCGLPLCNRCNELGHTSKNCSEEYQENADRATVKCFNCDEVGHRVRDCPVPREDKFACRNCKKSGHSSKECPEPRSAEGIECKKCGEVGHFSRDCPTGGGGEGGDGGLCRNCNQPGHRAKDCTEPRVIICRNCDEEGHTGKECPKPRDYSRVQCTNCKQMGHTKVRCKEPIVDDDGGNDHGGNTAYDGGNAESGVNAAPEPAYVPAEPVIETGGWGGNSGGGGGDW